MGPSFFGEGGERYIFLEKFMPDVIYVIYIYMLIVAMIFFEIIYDMFDYNCHKDIKYITVQLSN